MPKIICKCKEIIDLSEIPTPNQYMFISDIDYDKFTGSIDSEDLYMEMNIMIKCPNCGRLHIYWDGFDNPSKIYTFEK